MAVAMTWSVVHTLHYDYSLPVFLEPQILRLQPRADSHCCLKEFHLTVSPKPDGMSLNLEDDGSTSRLVWFSSETKEFTVEMRAVVQLTRQNPFAFMIHPFNCRALPMHYPAPIYEPLSAYCFNVQPSAAVVDFANAIVKAVRGDVVQFLTKLCEDIHASYIYETRDDGEPHEAAKTLLLGRGSCRDLAVLFIETARAVGLAARFVSGYCFEGFESHPQLHAWAEVFIPGAGWRGYDPTLGLVCAGEHVALVSAILPSLTAPVAGHFRGTAKFSFKTQMDFRNLTPEPRV